MERQYFKQNIAVPSIFHNTVNHVFDIIIQTVGATFGPYGTHNIFMNGPGDATSSKDGLENLTMMKMDGSIARVVHQMAMEVAYKQASVVGDGTTSAILVMAYVYKNLRNNKHIWEKYTPSMIYQAMREIQNELISVLESQAMTIRDDSELTAIAYTSTDRSSELTQLLMQLYNEERTDFADKNFILSYSNTDKSYFQSVQGITVSGRLMHPAFANYDTESCKLTNCQVIVVDGAPIIENDILNYVNSLRLQGKSLVIICSGVNENFYRYIEYMAQSQPALLNNLCVVYTKANATQDADLFNDLMATTGCAYLKEGSILSNATITSNTYKTGFATDVLYKDRKLTLSGFTPDEKFENYVRALYDRMKETEEKMENPQISSEEKTALRVKLNTLKNRYHRLTSGTTTIYVGGESPQRKTINYRLIEDALKAMQCSLKHGYFTGCNTAPLNAIYQMMINQKELNPNEDDIYMELEKILLKSYLDVYMKLISNRAQMSVEDYMKLIVDQDFYHIVNYNSENGCIISVDLNAKDKVVFRIVNLTSDANASIVLNPALTDINIVSRSVDSALVLATSNTIMTDMMEFDGRSK